MLLPTKPRPSQAARQDATAPSNLYRTNPASPATPGNAGNAVVRGMRAALPLNVAMLAQDVSGNTAPLTEKSLQPAELYALRQAARHAGQQQPERANYDLSYPDYPRLEKGTANSLAGALSSPSGRVQTTVGSAAIARGDNAQSTLTDRYNFNRRYTNSGNPGLDIEAAGAGQGPYAMIRALAERVGSHDEQSGARVKINLGNLKRPMPGESIAAPTDLPKVGLARQFKVSQQLHQVAVQRKARGGLLPGKLTMLGPDGKAQMELGGGNRIFSRANTRELVGRSQRAKTPAELKELGGRIKTMLDQQDRNKPEYVKD